jgi:hypothetical protein
LQEWGDAPPTLHAGRVAPWGDNQVRAALRFAVERLQ